MEGNLYIADFVVDRALRSRYGQAYRQCQKQALRYGKCVDVAQVNHQLVRNCCLDERRDLRKCIDVQLKSARSPSPSAGCHSQCRLCSAALTTARRAVRYSPFDSIRKSSQQTTSRRGGNKTSSSGSSGSSGSDTATHTHDGHVASTTTASTTSSGTSHIRRREQTERVLQSPAEARAEAQMFFPQTLRSGRYAQHNTVAQRIVYATDRTAAAAVAEQRARDRAYAAALRDARVGDGVDRRFMQPLQDYRDIVDGDAYSGVFGESAATRRLRIAAWQQQFERENAHVELPYERTSWLRRRMPNRLVRLLVNVRDRGGIERPRDALLLLGSIMGSSMLLAYVFWPRYDQYTASVSEARRCQLLLRDLHGVLLLASRVCYGDGRDADAAGSAMACATGLLTEAHVRGLVVNTLVRVSVPRSKRNALLLRNPYVQRHDEQQRALADSKRSNNNNSNSNNASSAVTMTHRVGRVVALLPKPSHTDAAGEQQQQQQQQTQPGSTVTASMSWLVAVHFGECVELVAVRHVSDDAFSEDEHDVYVSSALGTLVTHTSANTATSSDGGSDTPMAATRGSDSQQQHEQQQQQHVAVLATASTRATLLSAEHALAVQQTLHDVRIAMQALYATTTTTTDDGSTSNTAACVSLSTAVARAAALWGCRHDARTAASSRDDTAGLAATTMTTSVAVKRARADDDDGNLATTRVKREDDDDDDDSALPPRRDGDDAATAFAQQPSSSTSSLSLLLQRTRDEHAQMRAQLQRLRGLLSARDAEVVRSVQQQRQADEAHTRTLAQWRSKLEEESATRARMQSELTQTIQEQQTLLEQANVKLRRLAEMTTAYKAVVDELRTRLVDGTTGVTAAQLQRPDAVLAELRRRRTLPS